MTLPARRRSAAPASARTSAVVLAATLAAAGTLHLVRPRPFEGLIPRRLGPPRPWVVGSGVAELACAGALLHPATRPAGALATAALFVGVFPGNVTMAVRASAARRRREESRPSRRETVAWARLPLQVPLVLWALRLARSA